MARARASFVYVGIKNQVMAFDRKTGAVMWATPLPAKYKTSASFVNVVRDAEGLFVGFAGEIFSLDPKDGSILWRDPLKGLGTGLLTIATDLGGQTGALAAMVSAEQAQAAATTAATTAAV